MALKKLILFASLWIIIVLTAGCKKNDEGCNPNPPASEATQIQAYAADNGISAVAHPSGMYYEIINQGSGGTAMLNSKIFITYVGTLLNGTKFDEQTTPNLAGWTLGGLIEGWRIGIPLIQKGGHIKLIVPSALAYGCEPYNTLPANSILFFDITLVDIQ